MTIQADIDRHIAVIKRGEQPGLLAQPEGAAQALMALGPHVLPSCISWIKEEPWRALCLSPGPRAIILAYPKEALPLLEQELDQMRDKEKRLAVCALIVAIGPSSPASIVRLLMDVIRNESYTDRVKNALGLLAKLGEEAGAAVPLLLDTLSYDSWELRETAAFALGEIAVVNRSVLKGLNALVANDPNEFVRKTAWTAINKLPRQHVPWWQFWKW